MPEIGDSLNREELSQHYGKAFNRLVLIDAGRVLAVAARKTYNPEAPEIILAGPGDAREEEIAS